MLTNRATHLEVSQSHQIWYTSHVERAHGLTGQSLWDVTRATLTARSADCVCRPSLVGIPEHG